MYAAHPLKKRTAAFTKQTMRPVSRWFIGCTLRLNPLRPPHPPSTVSSVRRQAQSFGRNCIGRSASMEEDNTGLQAAHATEQGGERRFVPSAMCAAASSGMTGISLKKAEKRLDRANVDFLQRSRKHRRQEAAIRCPAFISVSVSNASISLPRRDTALRFRAMLQAKRSERRLKPFAGKKNTFISCLHWLLCWAFFSTPCPHALRFWKQGCKPCDGNVPCGRSGHQSG